MNNLLDFMQNICYNKHCCCKIKGEWLFILSELSRAKLSKTATKENSKAKRKSKEHTKFQKLKIIAVNTAKIIITIIMLSGLYTVYQYKTAYAVVYNGEIIGYVSNKDDFQNEINDKILTAQEENIAFVTLDEVTYNREFVKKSLIAEESVLATLKENSKNIYKVYEVSNGNEEAVYVNTEEEANEIVETLKAKYDKVTDDLAITTLYLEEEVTEEAIENAKAKMSEELQTAQTEQEEIEARTVNGVYLAVLPVTGGSISSRFGSRESIRSHTHQGLDIAASYGTPIKAVASGTVIYSGTQSGYGNLVAIDHGNSVTTYYGHCSKLLVSVGDEVEAGDIIAKVGSTGNSTGNHLHFEIRINGTRVNPQNYLYN